MVECAFTSRFLGLSYTGCHGTIDSSEGRSRFPITPRPRRYVDGVRVQKTPNLLLDVLQVSPAKRHPGHVTEEAVQALGTQGEGTKRVKSVTWGKSLISFVRH